MREACVRGATVRVLIVDDSDVLRKIVEDALRHIVPHLGEVLHAANGIEGLAALERSVAEQRPLSLILCDLHMPTMDGLEFLLEKQRRNLAQGVPVAMFTADASGPRLLRAVAAAGAQCHLPKPFTLEQLGRCVSSLLPADCAPAPTDNRHAAR